MKIMINALWIVSIIVIFLSLVWFIMGTTACFQRQLDLVSTVVLFFLGVSSLVMIGLLVYIIKNNWFPRTTLTRFCLLGGIILIIIIITTTCFRYSTTYGWFRNVVYSDYLQTTDDEKYEYRLELVNLFQKNQYARLYVKNNTTGEEIKIMLDLPLDKIGALQGGVGYEYPEPMIPKVWSQLSQTAREEIYILKTTDWFHKNTYTYKIDMRTKVAEKEYQ